MSTFTQPGGLYDRARKRFKLSDGKKLFNYSFFEKQRFDCMVRIVALSLLIYSFFIWGSSRHTIARPSRHSSPTSTRRQSTRGPRSATVPWRLSGAWGGYSGTTRSTSMGCARTREWTRGSQCLHLEVTGTRTWSTPEALQRALSRYMEILGAIPVLTGSCSPPCTHTHFRTNFRTHTHTHTQTHVRTHTHTLASCIYYCF